MTWLRDLPAGETDWDRLAALWPEAVEALAGVLSAAWKETDPVLFELCRLRVAAILGYGAEERRRSERARLAGVTDEKVASLPGWPTSPLFTAKERSCLAFAEQFVIDANGVTGAQVEELTSHLGAPGCYGFVQAVSVLETFQRACQTMGVESAPPIDELIQPDRTDA